MSQPRGFLRSVRVRLALWHTATLALVLTACAVATWIYLERVIQRRVDRSLREAVVSFEHAVMAERRNGRTPEDAAYAAAREFRFSERRVLVYGARHRLIAISDSTRDSLTQAVSAVEDADDSPLHPMFASLVPGASAYGSIGAGGNTVRGYASSVALDDETLTIVALQVGLSESAILGTFLQAALVVIPLALLLAGAGGYLLARRSFAPVIDMGRQASSIDSARLGTRLPVRETGDEMDELASIFNDMLARLERSFTQQQQFVADASHELRTPIASLRAAVGIALSQSRAPDEYEHTLAHVRDESRRVSAILDDLLTTAQLDAEAYQLHREEFFLEEAVHGAVTAIRPLSQERGVRIEFTPSEEGRVEGDPLLISRVLTNLLDNAVKYSPRGGVVRVDMTCTDAQVAVHVTDQGQGIPEDARARIFDRFYRADEARTRAGAAATGAGLGLAIAWRIARAHGGNVELTRSDDRGSTLTLVLPAKVRQTIAS